MIRHITEAGNVNHGKVIDPGRSKHGVVTAGKISDLSGWVDPATHLNLDFPGSLMESVVIAKTLEIGSEVLTENGRFMFGQVNPHSYGHHGCVDLVDRTLKIHELAMARSLKG